MMMRETMEQWWIKPTAITLATVMALGGCAHRSGEKKSSPEPQPPACTVEVTSQNDNEVEVGIVGDAEQHHGAVERVDYGDGTSEEHDGRDAFLPHAYRKAGHYAISGGVRYPNGRYFAFQPCVGVDVDIPRK